MDKELILIFIENRVEALSLALDIKRRSNNAILYLPELLVELKDKVEILNIHYELIKNNLLLNEKLIVVTAGQEKRIDKEWFGWYCRGLSGTATKPIKIVTTGNHPQIVNLKSLVKEVQSEGIELKLTIIPKDMRWGKKKKKYNK